MAWETDGELDIGEEWDAGGGGGDDKILATQNTCCEKVN
jgi:hypothetical protein